MTPNRLVPAALALILSGCSGPQAPATPKVSEPTSKCDKAKTISPSAPTPAGPVDQGRYDARLKGYVTPPGFKVEIAADYPAVINPVAMAFGTDGTLYVTEWTQEGGHDDKLKALRSRQGDGKFDEIVTLADSLYLPAGLLIHDGWLYVPQDDELWRMPMVEGRPLLSKRQVLAKGFSNDQSHHRLSGVTLGPDGWIYLTTGDSDTRAVGRDGARANVLRSGGVFRIRPDGSNLENVAFGMRNPFGDVTTNSAFDIFHTDNDNEDGSNFQGCRLLHVAAGGDYGWRLRYGARCCSPDHARGTWAGERPGRLGTLIDTGRGAPTGVTVLNSAAFPPSLADTLIHPDVFRKAVRLYRVQAQGAGYKVVGEEPLLTATGPDADLFRPSDAAVGPDGALYVLDWHTDSGGAGKLSGDGKHGRIYRITWTGTADQPGLDTLPWGSWKNLATLPDSALVQHIVAGDLHQATHASHQLARRGAAGRQAAFQLLMDAAAPTPARLQAFSVFASQWGQDSESAARKILAAADKTPPKLLAWVTKQLADRPKSTLTPSLTWPIEHQSVLVVAAAAWGLARHGGTEALPALLAVLHKGAQSDDPMLANALQRSLDELGTPAVTAVKTLCSAGDLPTRTLGINTLIALRHPTARTQRLALAMDDTLPEAERARLFAVLPADASEAMPATIGRWLARKDNTTSAPLRLAALQALVTIGEQHPKASKNALLPIVRKMLGDSDEPLRIATMEAAARWQIGAASGPIADIAKDAEAGADLRVHAITALAELPGVRPTKLLQNLSAQSAPEAVRVAALRALVRVDYKRALPLATSLLKDQSAAVRAEAIVAIGRTPKGAQTLIEEMRQSRLPQEDLPRILEAATPHRDADTQRMAGILLAERGANQGHDVQALATLARRMGRPKEGRELFLDRNRVGCVQCHEREGQGGNIGPSLTGLDQTLSMEKLIEAVLEPSREIKESFQTWNALLNDGSLVMGRLVAQQSDGVVIQDAMGTSQRLPRKDIKELIRSDVSLMPEGTTAHLPLQQLADLMAYLVSGSDGKTALKTPTQSNP